MTRKNFWSDKQWYNINRLSPLAVPDLNLNKIKLYPGGRTLEFKIRDEQGYYIDGKWVSTKELK